MVPHAMGVPLGFGSGIYHCMAGKFIKGVVIIGPTKIRRVSPGIGGDKKPVG